MATLIYLLADGDYTFFNEDTDGIQKAEINKIAAQVYVADEDVADFVEAMITTEFGGYLIPSEYTGEVVFSEDILNNTDLLHEAPEDLNWDIVNENLSGYYSRQDVCDSNDFAKYVDEYNEFDLEDETDLKIIKSIEANCPTYLTKMQWAYHQMTELNIELFNEAMNTKK